MENAVVFSMVNINLTLMYRMIQQTSPFSIKLHRIKQYETPYGTSLKCMKIMFSMLVVYMGFPLACVWGTMLFPLYLIHWFITILWWHYFVTCQFKKCIYSSTASSVTLLVCIQYFFESYRSVAYMWMPLLWWSCFAMYLSIWYTKSYVNTNLILP